MSIIPPIRAMAIALVVAAAATATSGCAAASEFTTIAESVEQGLPDNLPPAPSGQELQPRVIADGPDDPITIVSRGSSSCPALPTAASVIGGTLVITLRIGAAEVCTADDAPTTSRIPAVAGFDPAVVTTARLTVENQAGDGSSVSVPIELLN